MRSTETRARNGLAESGRRNSKTLKLRLKQPASALPPPSPVVEGHAQASSYLLYSQQLWKASGNLQLRLTCDRHLYYPDLAVAAPVAKQLPDESAVDAQQGKRAKLAGGQYRRSFREAVSDSSPPGTPFKPSRQNLPQQQQSAVEERANSNAFASTSSSSSHDISHPRRQSASSTWESGIAWPIVVPCKRRRSSRQRRVQWQQWPPVLQELDMAPSSSDNLGMAAADASAADATAGDAVVAVHAAQQQQPLCSAEQPAALRQHLTTQPFVQQALVVGGLQQLEQAAQQAAGAVLQPTPATPLLLQSACALGAENAAAVPAASAVCKNVLAAVAGKAAAAAGGDASPGQETSQFSDTTCMQDSPRAAATLSSWPSSSTESDCQAQPPHQCDAAMHKASLAAAVTAAGGKRPLVGQSASPESPSSPLHGVF